MAFNDYSVLYSLKKLVFFFLKLFFLIMRLNSAICYKRRHRWKRCSPMGFFRYQSDFSHYDLGPNHPAQIRSPLVSPSPSLFGRLGLWLDSGSVVKPFLLCQWEVPENGVTAVKSHQECGEEVDEEVSGGSTVREAL